MKVFLLALVLVVVFATLVDSKPPIEDNSQEISGSSRVADGGQETSTQKGSFLTEDVATGSPRLALYFDRCAPGFKIDRTGKCRKLYYKK